jgi:hypothetical protein
MRITHLPSFLWYETKNGKKLYLSEKDWQDGYILPKGAVYQVSRFPISITTNYLYLHPDGRTEEMGSSNSPFHEDLVLAMANSGEYRLSHAMIIASEACERCTNVLAHNYGLDWGYAENSEEWKKSNTLCEYCKDHWISNLIRQIKLFIRWHCRRLHVSK